MTLLKKAHSFLRNKNVYIETPCRPSFFSVHFCWSIEVSESIKCSNPPTLQRSKSVYDF